MQPLNGSYSHGKRRCRYTRLACTYDRHKTVRGWSESCLRRLDIFARHQCLSRARKANVEKFEFPRARHLKR